MIHFLPRNGFLVFACLAFFMGEAAAQPQISFSFDDGMIADRPGFRLEEWNQLLLDKLEKEGVRAILFVAGNNKSGAKGRYVLQSWNDQGHLIANHTVHHPNYNNEKTTYSTFREELLSNDSLIKGYSNYVKLFRFPYLKEGNTPEKVDAFRTFMKEIGYRNGYVTIDASDWYIDNRLVARLKENPEADLSGFKEFYLEHIWERAQFYEHLSYELNHRHIAHSLLLHHNLAAALFIGDLIQLFQDKGWRIVSAEEAYADPVYAVGPKYAGESLIYAQAKDSGRYDDILRYPAEDGRYEEKRMNALGL